MRPFARCVGSSADIDIVLLQLMPLLLRGLNLPDAEIRTNVIDTLLTVADPASKTSGSIVAEHASSLVATMLKNSMVRQMPSVVRIVSGALC